MKYKIVACALLVANASYAADQCTKAVGTNTPCAGVVLPTTWAIEGEKCRSVELPKCKAEATAIGLSKDASITALSAELDVERKHAKKLEERLLSCTVPVVKVEEVPWYKSSWFVFGAGFVLGAGTVIGGIYGANSAK